MIRLQCLGISFLIFIFSFSQNNNHDPISQGALSQFNGCLAISQSAENLEIIYDGNSNVDTVNTWLANNGNATVNSSCGEVNWSYSITNDFLEDSDGDSVADRLNIEIEFIASASGGDQVFTTALIVFNNFATAGESAGNGGAICDDNFPVSNFDDDISFPGDGVNYTDSKFASSSFELTQTFGKPGLQLLNDGTTIKFPDTGAGQFSYNFDFKVLTTVAIGNEVPRTYETETFYTANNVTVAFDPGPNKTIYVCDFNNIDLLALYEELDIALDVDTTEFNEAEDFGNVFEPENSWYNETDDLEANPDTPTLTEITAPGVYQFNAKKFLEDCAGEPVFVTLVQLGDDAYNILDIAFEQALIDQNIDEDGVINGQIINCDIDNITSLSLIGYDIYDFDALQYFTGLINFTLIDDQSFLLDINFDNNPMLENITIINVPQLINLGLTQNIEMKELTVVTYGINFGIYTLNELDLSQNVNLESLYVSFNQLFSIVLGNNLSLENLDLSNNYLRSIDVSGLSDLRTLNVQDNFALDVLDVSNNPFLENLYASNTGLNIINLKNGANSILSNVILENINELNCVLVDNVSFAQDNINWLIDDNSVYTQDSICSINAINNQVLFDGVGNHDEVIDWLNNNGGAIVYSPSPITWTNDFTVSQINDQIIYNSTFQANNGSETFTTNGIFTILTYNIDAGDDFEPVEGDVAGGIEEEGSLCEQETGSFDLGVYTGREGGTNYNYIDYSSPLYQNAVFEIEQIEELGTGGTITNIDGTVVTFPDTGAGQFSYYYSFNVSMEVQFYGMSDVVILSDEASLWHWLTIPFDPTGSENYELNVCSLNTTSLSDLYAILEIVNGTSDAAFIPENYWFDTGGNPLTEYNGPGDYIFNAEDFLPQCGGIPTTVTVNEIEQLSAGEDGNLVITPGTTLTESQMFEALEGEPDPGGNWSPSLDGPGEYTYLHAANVCPESSAKVTVTESTLSGINYEFNNLRLFPNPVSTIINIQGNTTILDKLIIYSVTGQKIVQIERDFHEIDVSKLEAGVYFLKLYAANHQRHIRFIKE